MLRICSPFQAYILILMVSSGTLITLDLKWSDEIPSLNSINEVVPFSHPFLPSTFMFIGELLCLGVYFIQKWWKRSMSDCGTSQKQAKGK